eukprot:CAMPEP_0183812790 /NCGR_PEP_ID=MMETSP0803_2-20130417/51833_1 /TAXON_ID=195967 /ORGANISM="Crustomastix stigmata, Strain CCMP3273" /LENGTH=46 /DNA_ID= /DNA_START= /DNA_END= /DNA_ORIENTATION=
MRSCFSAASSLVSAESVAASTWTTVGGCDGADEGGGATPAARRRAA